MPEPSQEISGEFIVMTPAQADLVRGLSIPGHALAPVLLDDGTFILPLEVLNDPAHAALKSVLEGFPKSAVSFKGLPMDVRAYPEIAAAINYNENWISGTLKKIPTNILSVITSLIKPKL